MQDVGTLHSARVMALAVHRSQVDDGGNPYMEHVISVVNRVSWLEDDETTTAALLHDVIERHVDSSFATRFIMEKFNPRIVGAVCAVTRRIGQPYEEHITGVIHGGISAMAVKIAELLDNLSSARLRRIMSPWERSRADKYGLALHRLKREWYKAVKSDFQDNMEAIIVPKSLVKYSPPPPPAAELVNLINP